ncbi:MAG TPA: ABC transporter substrate-binding protein [Streptosporangiaceae bacterium]|jgi:peptide/nickel transport system substrate-binding protein
MALQPKRFAALAVVALAAGGLAACGGSSSSGTSSASAGTPVSGGTLRIVAASGPDHIDTVPAYYTPDYMLERGYARQMLAYPASPATSTSSPAWTKATTPEADVSTVIPSTSNGGITNGGKTYTFHIKPGVQWDSTPVRPVVAADFVREFKAFCNPAPGGFVGNIVYFEDTIAGLKSYCDKETAFFASKANAPTAANVAKFQNTNTISGLSAPSASTLQVNLTQSASDFLYIMSLPFTSARPVEYDAYLPNSPQLDQHTVSDGPYKITSYLPGKSISLARNTAWKQSTDTLRHQYVSNVAVTLGVTSAQTQLTDMQAGSQDLPMDTSINPPSLPGLEAAKKPNFSINAWTDIFPYVVFNLRSPNSGGAMSKVLVRQAVEYGIDKSAVQKVYGGPTVTKQLGSVIPPGNVGALTNTPYPQANGGANTAKCKADLKQAGESNLTLTYLYANDSVNTSVFTAIQASLKQCGITLKGKAEPGSSFFTDLGNAPVNNKSGTWDMGQPAWIPDWFGLNGRSVIPPFFQTDCVVNTINYGCYSSKTMDALIKQAEAATSNSTAASLWGQANTMAMQQALIVPLQSQLFPMYTSTRIHGPGAFQPNIGDPDITNLWISG